MSYVVIVTGGRQYANAKRVNAILTDWHEAHGIRRLAHGGATGADALAGEWAQAHGVPVGVYTADWTQFGRAAGPIRNEAMLRDEMPDVVIAFPGGRGTAHMVSLAKARGVAVHEVL